MTTGPDGNLWIADNPGSLTNSSLARMTTDGKFTSFDIPAGVVYPATSSKDKVLWFEYETETEGGLGTFDPATTTYRLFPISPSIGVGDLFTGLDGNAYFVPDLGGRRTGLIIRVTPQGKVTRFANVPKQLGDPRPNINENVDTVWYGGADDHLYGWTTQGHQLIDEGSFPAFQFPIHFTVVGPDDNIWFQDGVFLRRLLTVAPQSATIGIGGEQSFSIRETNCPKCVWSAVSSNPGVASASAVTGSSFTVTGQSAGSATITVSDKRSNVVQVPIAVN